MTDDPPKPAPQASPQVPAADEDREAILARRNRFVQAALKGLAGASLVAACLPQACLECADDGCGRVSSDASPEASPEPCLSVYIPPDAGRDAEDARADALPDADASPQPCLSPLPPDSGPDAAGDAQDQ